MEESPRTLSDIIRAFYEDLRVRYGSDAIAARATAAAFGEILAPIEEDDSVDLLSSEPNWTSRVFKNRSPEPVPLPLSWPTEGNTLKEGSGS